MTRSVQLDPCTCSHEHLSELECLQFTRSHSARPVALVCTPLLCPCARACIMDWSGQGSWPWAQSSWPSLLHLGCTFALRETVDSELLPGGLSFRPYRIR